MDNPTWLIGVDYLQNLVAGSDPRPFRRTPTLAADVPDGELELRERLIGLTGRTAELRTAGRLADSVAVAAEAHRLLLDARIDGFTHLTSTLPHLTIQWARAMDIADDPTAFEIYEDTYQTSLLTNQPRVARRAAAHLAWMYADQGHTIEARHWLDRGTAIDAPIDRYDIPLHLTAALLAVDALEFDEARRHITTAGQYPVGEYWAASLWVRSLFRDPADAIIAVNSDLAREVRRHPAGLVTRGANLRYVTLTGWVLYARGLAPVAGHGPDACESDSIRHLLDAELAYRKGSFAEALRRCSPVLSGSTTPRLRGGALLIAAASRLRLGQPGSGVEPFRQAHALIVHENLLLTFSVVDDDDLRELVRLSGRQLPASVVRLIDERSAFRRPSIPSLSRRELEVLGLLASDMPSARIAASLFITMNTLKSTLRHIYRKLGVHDRQTASDIARQLGIDRGNAPSRWRAPRAQ